MSLRADIMPPASPPSPRRTGVVLRLMGSVLLLVLLGGGATWWVNERGRQARRARTAEGVHRALQDAARWWGQARADEGNLVLWERALAASQQAGLLLADGESEPSLRQQVAAQLARLEDDERAARAHTLQRDEDRALLRRLEVVRLRPDSPHAYAAAFAVGGVNVDRTPLAALVAHFQARPAEVRHQLAAALDAWVVLDLQTVQDVYHRRAGALGPVLAPVARLLWELNLALVLPACRRRSFLASALDEDSLRRRVRECLLRPGALRHFRILADPLDAHGLPAATAVLVAGLYQAAGADDRALAWLRQAQRDHPGDFWVNRLLALALEKTLFTTKAQRTQREDKEKEE